MYNQFQPFLAKEIEGIKEAGLYKKERLITSTQAANQVWDQETSIALLNEEFDKLGIRVGDKHIIDNLSKDPNIGQNQMFQNELGKFDLNKFKEFFKSNPGQEQYLIDREKDAV